jgi:hypothetical protein
LIASNARLKTSTFSCDTVHAVSRDAAERRAFHAKRNARAVGEPGSDRRAVGGTNDLNSLAFCHSACHARKHREPEWARERVAMALTALVTK